MPRLLTFVLILGALSLSAQKIPFQGKLTENDEPVTGAKTFTFGFPSINWTETHENVSVLDGYYQVVLGSIAPLPDSLFAVGDEEELTITVDGTSLGSVLIYRPYRSHVYFDQYDGTRDEPALLVRRTGQDGSSMAAMEVVSEMEGDSYALYGQATGAGDNYGVYGYAQGTGKNNAGLFGNALGEGNGVTGFGDGSYNNGVIGWARDNAWGNSGVYGRAYGEQGVDNIGVVGWGEVNNGSDTIANTGVLGWAKGPGVNYGVRGMASDGAANWAGWFDGPVNVNGELLVNGASIGGIRQSIDSIKSKDVAVVNEAGKLRAHLNVFNDAGSLVLHNANDSTKAIIGSAFGGYGSSLYLHDSLGHQGARLRVAPEGRGILDLFNEAHEVTTQLGNYDESGGFLRMSGRKEDGSFSGATLTGFASWNNNLPYFFMEGSSEDPYVQLLQFGLMPNALGEGSYFNMNTSARALAGKGNLVHLATASDEASNDPNGESGLLELWGDESVNLILSGKTWEDNDQAYFQMYGSNENGEGWYHENIVMQTLTNGRFDGGQLSMLASQPGAENRFETVYLTGIGVHSSGELVLSDSTGTNTSRTYHDGVGGRTEFYTIDGMSNSSIHASGMEYSNAGTVTISLDGTNGTIDASAFNQSSDRRLKQHIRIQKDALSKIKQLRGVSYEWKSPDKPGRQIGLIAQEVEKVYPEMVATREDGFKAVNYSVLVSSLVEAVKELDAKVASLEKQNEALKAQVLSANAQEMAALKSEIASIRLMLSSKVETSETTDTAK